MKRLETLVAEVVAQGRADSAAGNGAPLAALVESHLLRRVGDVRVLALQDVREAIADAVEPKAAPAPAKPAKEPKAK